MEYSMYVCPECRKVFKVNGNNKKVKCSQCSVGLIDMNISMENWGELDKGRRDEIKNNACNSNIDIHESVEIDNPLPKEANDIRQSFFDDVKAADPTEVHGNVGRPELNVCPKCNKPIQITSRFCPECGYNLNKKRKSRERKSIKPIYIIAPIGVILLALVIAVVTLRLQKAEKHAETQSIDTSETTSADDGVAEYNYDVLYTEEQLNYKNKGDEAAKSGDEAIARFYYSMSGIYDEYVSYCSKMAEEYTKKNDLHTAVVYKLLCVQW